MIVVDASIVIDLLLDVQPFADRIAEVLEQHEGDLHAPHLLDAEVGQVLRRYVIRRDLRPARAVRALERLEELPLTRYPHIPFVRRSFELRRNLTFYDALYVALAEALGVPLLTKDGALARVPSVRAAVLVLR